ncbi:BON domain-containing protein [Gemmatimonas sp.]|uniref:BON domain-containing protein n=1 Tax=Gemmatimonas sp. TaxID=1962908 RepID=UPI003983A715
MSTTMTQSLDAHAFPPLSPPQLAKRTVFDNGVEAEIDTITDRRRVRREDHELLAGCTRAMRDAPNVPTECVVASVNDGKVVLNGRTSFYYERAAAECAVRFLDGVRSVENHITVQLLVSAHDVPNLNVNA